jgi:hypothetical protein
MSFGFQAAMVVMGITLGFASAERSLLASSRRVAPMIGVPPA